MTRIVTCTYRCKPLPKRRGRRLAMITGPAIVIAKKSRHPVLEEAAAAEGALCHGARLGAGARVRDSWRASRQTSRSSWRPGVPRIELRWRCAHCGSRLTDWVVA